MSEPKDTTEGQTPITAPDVTGDGKQPEPERTFSQSEVNTIIGDRISRVRAKFADYDELKAKADAFAEYEHSQLSELEQAQTRVTELEAERDEANANATKTLIRAAFIAEAAQAGVAHPEDAYRLAELTSVNVGEDGAITGVAEVVKTLVDAGRLVMVAQRQAPNLNGGAGGGQWAIEQVASLTPEELESAKKTGVTPEQYAESKAAIAARRQR